MDFEGIPGGQRQERLYLSRDTGLLVRRVVLHRTAFDEVAEQADNADYHAVDGVNPLTTTRQEVGARWIEKYEEMKFMRGGDESKFLKPAPK